MTELYVCLCRKASCGLSSVIYLWVWKFALIGFVFHFFYCLLPSVFCLLSLRIGFVFTKCPIAHFCDNSLLIIDLIRLDFFRNWVCFFKLTTDYAE